MITGKPSEPVRSEGSHFPNLGGGEAKKVSNPQYC